MKADEIREKIKLEKNFEPNYSQLAKILKITRQSLGYYKENDLPENHLKALEDHFHVSFTKSKTGEVENLKVNGGNTDPCVDIPVRGEVFASMGCGVTVYDENQTGTYRVSKKLVSDLGSTQKNLEMIFAQGNSMSPTIESGDSLIIDRAKKEVYDGKIYCVRIDGQLFAKRLQKIPPHSVNVVSDNPQYESFKIDFSKKIDFDFEVIGEIRWCGRVMK